MPRTTRRISSRVTTVPWRAASSHRMSKSPVVSSTGRSSSVAARRAPSIAMRPAVSAAWGSRPGVERRAAQQRLDAREQHARLDGLHHVVVGAHLEAQHLVDVLALGREDQDGHRAAGAKLAADRQAVLARKHQVQHHELGAEALDAVGHGEAIALDQDLVTVALEVVPDGCGEARAVLDQQHARAAGRFRGGVSSCQGLSVHRGARARRETIAGYPTRHFPTGDALLPVRPS